MAEQPRAFKGMLPNGKLFIATQYYERYYEYPQEYPLIDRDLEDLTACGWTVAFTDYWIPNWREVWDHYFDTAKRLGLFVMPDQWTACFHTTGYGANPAPATNEDGEQATQFSFDALARYCGRGFIDTMVEYQARVVERYIDHPAYARVLGPDGAFHPLIVVIYEAGMCGYDGKWIDYSEDTRRRWVEFQKSRGRTPTEDMPTPTKYENEEMLVLWNEFRARYLADGWNAVARGLKKRFPGLYTAVIFRQHGLLEGSKSGGDAGGIGRRAIRPELWEDFDIVASEHDGDDGIEFVLAEADLIRCAAKGRLGALEFYLNSGWKAFTARPVEFDRPWGQSEMLGSLAVRGLLPMHYGYNERDDKAGIAAFGRREPDDPLLREDVCREVAEANRVFADVAPYLYAATPTPAKAGIVMPYEAYALANNNEITLDKRLVAIWERFLLRDIPVDWVFSSSTRIDDYRLVVVPEALYSSTFIAAIAGVENSGAVVLHFPNDKSLRELDSTLDDLTGELRSSPLPVTPGVESRVLKGSGYEALAVVNHIDTPITYTIEGQGQAYPEEACLDKKLTVRGHSSAYWLNL